MVWMGSATKGSGKSEDVHRDSKAQVAEGVIFEGNKIKIFHKSYLIDLRHVNSKGEQWVNKKSGFLGFRGAREREPPITLYASLCGTPLRNIPQRLNTFLQWERK